MKIFLIYPVTLFDDKKILSDVDEIYIIEDHSYFTRLKFHKLKLAYHRATMKCFYDGIKRKYKKVHYIEVDYVALFYKKIKKRGDDIFLFDPIDKPVLDQLTKTFKNFTLYDNPGFCTKREDFQEYHELNKKRKTLRHDSSFYRWQRKRLGILDLKAYKLTYDHENREPFPCGQKDVMHPKKVNNKYTREAIAYVEKKFPENFGSLDYFVFPITHKAADRWFDNFLKERFYLFGRYEDAFSADVIWGYHAAISPMLNIGLLTEDQILKKVLACKDIPINSKEGFIRQIIGWRNYNRYVYEFYYNDIINKNFFSHNKKVPLRVIEGKTGIPPIDDVMKKIYSLGWCHHIERLMVLGNFLLLLRVKPQIVMNFFLEHVAMDAYDWVMLMNVLCMSQYADGGFVMTRPYFSSSNYIIKMSSYKKGNWADVWDALYYSFIDDNKTKLKSIYATARNVYHWNKKSPSEQERLRKLSRQYVTQLSS